MGIYVIIFLNVYKFKPLNKVCTLFMYCSLLKNYKFLNGDIDFSSRTLESMEPLLRHQNKFYLNFHFFGKVMQSINVNQSEAITSCKHTTPSTFFSQNFEKN